MPADRSGQKARAGAGRPLAAHPVERDGPADVTGIKNRPTPFPGWAYLYVESGGVLLSHTLPSAVPSALEGLASGFGMRPGVSPPL
jgi:hypothetical protein